jgi:hypothetical protein
VNGHNQEESTTEENHTIAGAKARDAKAEWQLARRDQEVA